MGAKLQIALGRAVPAERKWPLRWTLTAALGVSLLLWVLIIAGAMWIIQAFSG